MRLSDLGVRRALWLVLSLVLMTTGLAFAQATSTFNGRVLDQGDAVLPEGDRHGHQHEHGRGAYERHQRRGCVLPSGLEPGVYNVKTELPGFQPSARERVTLAINATITLDFKLALAGLTKPSP